MRQIDLLDILSLTAQKNRLEVRYALDHKDLIEKSISVGYCKKRLLWIDEAY